MASPIVQLAEDLKDLLNTKTFVPAATAERRIRVRDDLSTINDLNVWVVPSKTSSAAHSRRDDLVDYNIQIAVINPAQTDAEIDEMLELVEQIKEAVIRQDFSDVRYFNMTNDPIYDGNRVDEHGLFLSVITVEYKTLRRAVIEVTYTLVDDVGNVLVDDAGNSLVG